ncbi:MAG: sugar transferase [Solirubrobacteraceae bacterium]
MQFGGENSGLLVATAPAATRARSSCAERCFDIAITLLFLPGILVVAAAIALAIYIDSPGPVIYRSLRVGRDGQLFEILKFRKMRREAESHPVTLEDDDRFTPIGRFLASTRLDELPQVWNVLRGDMRLVGPRPELECFVTEYAAQYAEILSVTPGITGNAQLRFVDEKSLLRGPDPELTYTERVLPIKIEIDQRYARSRTLAGDFLILVRTAVLPFLLIADRACAPDSTLRRWIPTAASAALLALVFLVAASHLP